MNRRDRLLLRLGDPRLRGALFDPVALQQIAAAAYDTPLPSSAGAYSAVFDEVRLGVPMESPRTVDGWWTGAEPQHRHEARLRLAGGMPVSYLDAVWRGAIHTSVTAVRDRVVEVAGARTAVSGTDLTHTVRVRFAAADDGEPAPVPRALELPLTAALFLTEVTSSLAELLPASRLAVAALSATGAHAVAEPGLQPRSPVVPVWLMPVEVFDDEDWPMDSAATSAQERRAARRRYAGQWLSAQGIGLAVTAL